MSITQDTVGVQRAGFGLINLVSYNAAWSERHREYSGLAEVAVDFPSSTGPEQLAAAAIFSQDPSPEKMFISRGANKPTMVYTISLVTPVVGSAYELTAAGDGATTTDISVTPAADLVFTAENVSNVMTSVAHGLSTGDGPWPLTNAGGALPTGTAADTPYWIIELTDDTFQIAASLADALALTPVNFTTDGTGIHTLRRATNDAAIIGLVSKLNAVPGKNFTAARVAGGGDTDTMTVTASAPGEWFSIEVDFNKFVSYISHADPGIAADLLAINTEDSSWYELLTVYNSNAMVIAADAWVAANKKIYVFDTPNTVSVNGAVGGGGQDTIDNIKTLARARTMGAFHPSPASMLAAAWSADVLPLDPGSETWKFRRLTGPAPVNLTSTQRANLRAKYGNSYETVAGLNITFEGQTGDGDFLDIQRGLDWLEDDMTKRVFEALASNNKIPFTDGGIAIIEAQVRASLKEATARGIIATDPAFTVTVPRAASISAANKAARLLPDIKFTATLAGAVHKVVITGVVSL